MVLQKRSDYGFNGYQVPPIPRAARSVRGGSSPPSVDVSSEKEQPNCINNQGKDKDNRALEEKNHGQDCYERNFLFTDLVSETPNSIFCSNEPLCAQNDAISRPASGITTSDGSEKIGSAEQMANDDCKLRLGISIPTVDVESSRVMAFGHCGIENEHRKQIKMDSMMDRNLSINSRVIEMHCSRNLDAWDGKPSSLVSSVDTPKFPFSKDQTPRGPFPINPNTVKVDNRDDNENSSKCFEDSTKNKTFRPLTHIGDSRNRKVLLSKHGKVTSDEKDEEPYNADTERCNYLNKKNGLKRQRSLRDYPFKKRKLYDCSSVLNSNEGISNDGMCSLLENGINGSVMGSSLIPSRVAPTPMSATTGDHSSFKSRSSQVKLKIKSFRVPELCIEIPEDATVGSLKRTVMQAVNTVLGGGLSVGVLLQGKKIRDDNKTLAETGICHDKKMDCLGFTLEPSPTQAPTRLCPVDRSDRLLHDYPQPLARYPPTPNITKNAIKQRKLDISPDLPRTNMNSFIESDHDSAPSPPNMSLHKIGVDSKALVPLPTMKPDALAITPLRKSKRSGSAQRRIRRPFTVAEVEALVQAVEKLGTGRWRDVKLRAFDHAKHRTYVDLKDKWKTLVHTARISPQQRRGEPVPQELLDRVLTAHAYWSQHQAKQQIKSQPDTSLLL